MEFIWFYIIGLIALVAAFTTGFWWTVLFWIEMQIMQLEEDDWNSKQ
jgi:hypothetical protein